MGVVILTIMGAVMGWLTAVIVEREARVGTIACVVAGVGGAFVGALLDGSVPLSAGISAEQLLWGVLSAALAIVALNAVARGWLGRKTTRI